jgi:hypothetical protein
MHVGKARCKFRCDSVEPQGADTVKVTLGTHYDSELAKEDEAFSKYTPWGSMSFGVTNPALEGFFEPGKQYYVDIRPVE